MSTGWNQLLLVTEGLPLELGYVLACFSFFIFFIFPAYYLARFFENKLTADMQARVGHANTRLHGLFYGLIEDTKAFLKYSSITRRQLFYAAAQISFCLFLFSISPLGEELVFFENKNPAMNLYIASVFYCFFLFVTIEHEKKIEYIYFFRRILLVTLSAVVALACHLVVLQKAGADSWVAIVAAQKTSPVFGGALTNVSHFFCFFIYIIAGMVSVGAHPFFENKQDELSGGGFLNIIKAGTSFYYEWTWLFFAQTLFLSGWNTAGLFSNHTGVVLFFGVLKTTVLLVLIRTVTKTMPAMNMNQTLGFLCKYLAPAAIFILFIETIRKGF